LRILLVEDTETCAELTQRMLEEWDSTIECVNVLSLKAALDALDTAHRLQQRFDLVLLDLTLVDTSGLGSIVPTVHAAQPMGTPVLALSGAMLDLAPLVIQEGAAAFMSKDTAEKAPVQLWTLIQKLTATHGRT